MIEWFYTMQSKEHGRMEVAWIDFDMMTADRVMALDDPDKSDVSELQSRENDR